MRKTLLALALLSPALIVTPAAADPTQPNVVVILTDDMRADELKYLPNVRSLLRDHGLTFSRSYVSNALCCPSRTSLLTGNYSHTSGVYTNGEGSLWNEFGGYDGFLAHDNETRTIAYALDGAGYRTGLFGKSLNLQGTNPPLAGFDVWSGFAEDNGRYIDYTLNRDGVFTDYGSARSDYSTDVLAVDATEFVNTTPEGEPLFAYFAPYGPHGGAGIAPRRYFGDADGLNRPSGRAFNERDVSDKPRYIRRLPRLTAAERAKVAERNERRVEALLAVDDAVADIIDALESSGRLANTVIVFTSDNGHERGEHRWTDKLAPYDGSIHVPLVVRYDALGLAGMTSELAANVDVAPTIAELTGTAFGPVDGLSLVPLLTTGAPVRESMLLEHVHYGAKNDPPTYCGLRTPTRLFVRYATGENELYDTTADPAQLKNRAGRAAYAGEVAAFTDALRTACTPLPPGMPSF